MRRLNTTFVLLIGVTVALCQTHAIRVAKVGKGDPVLFLPGFTCPGSVWDETIKNLKGENESHIISYAGFNGIEPIEMPWYETIRKELLAYIRAEDLTGIRIIGHSMGGNLAVDVAAELPDRIKSLVLVDAIPCMRELMMPGVPASQLQYNSGYNRQMLAMPEEAFRQSATMMSQNMTTNKEKVDTLIKWSLEADRETYVYGFTDLLKLDLRDVLGRVKAKSLFLGASFTDKEMVIANFEKQYAGLADKTIEIATDSRHFVMFDQPEWFYEKVNSFLSK
jgi:pimeloyl-ACP methyl ester carboxylesterase